MNKLNYKQKLILYAGARKPTYGMSAKQYSTFLGANMGISAVSGVFDLINQIIFYEVNPELLITKYGNYSNPNGKIYTKIGMNPYASSIGLGSPYL